MLLVGPLETPAAVGGAGSATSNIVSTKPIRGRVVAAYLKYLDSPPGATTDVTVTTQGTLPNAPAQTILSVSNAATDGWFYPVTASHLNTTGAAVANEYVRGVPVHDNVVVTIAQANAADGVQCWLLLE